MHSRFISSSVRHHLNCRYPPMHHGRAVMTVSPFFPRGGEQVNLVMSLPLSLVGKTPSPCSVSPTFPPQLSHRYSRLVAMSTTSSPSRPPAPLQYKCEKATGAGYRTLVPYTANRTRACSLHLSQTGGGGGHVVGCRGGPKTGIGAGWTLFFARLSRLAVVGKVWWMTMAKVLVITRRTCCCGERE
ncbi:hypothetical protein BC567DRAFT_83107 [Phyllosticta citribraziliensis]